MSTPEFGGGPSGRARAATLLAVVVALAGLGGCSSGSARGAARPPVPAAAPVVIVTMVDNRFEFDPKIPTGRVVFRISNEGQAPHRLTMFPMPEEMPPIDEQLRGTQRRFLEPFAGIYNRAPGDAGTFAVDLAPGRRYAMICTLKSADGQPHWMKGMASEFRTPAAPPAPGAATPSPTD